jgi:EpsI family protein
MKIPGTKISFPVNRFVVEKGGATQIFFFWYHGRERLYASEMSNKFYLIWDAITKRRTDGALVRVHSQVKEKSDGGMKRNLEIQEEFIRDIFPYLHEFVPA